jgi:hypothetical protein
MFRGFNVLRNLKRLAKIFGWSVLISFLVWSCKRPCDENDPKSDCYIPPEVRIDAMFNFKGIEGVYNLEKEIKEFVKSPDFKTSKYNIKFKSDDGFEGALDDDMTSVTMTMEEIYKLIASFGNSKVESGGNVTVWEMSQSKVDKWKGWGYNVKIDDPRHITSYAFSQNNFDAIYPADNVSASADSAMVKGIHFVPEGHFRNFNTENISTFVDLVFKPAMTASKGKGKFKGNLEFTPGVITVPDSVWFVTNGATVNQH